MNNLDRSDLGLAHSDNHQSTSDSVPYCAMSTHPRNTGLSYEKQIAIAALSILRLAVHVHFLARRDLIGSVSPSRSATGALRFICTDIMG